MALNGHHTLAKKALQEYEKRGAEIRDRLSHYVMSDEKIKEVVAFCIETLVKNPTMKSHRIVIKAEEKFKLLKRVD